MSSDHFSSDLCPTSPGPVPIIYLMEHRELLFAPRKDLVKAMIVYCSFFMDITPHI